LSLAPQAPLCQLIYTISMARFTEVMFEGELTCYSSTSTLAEIAEDLAARDPNIARLIRFKTLTNGQLIGIGSDAVLRALRDSTQGEFRLMAQVRAPSVASSRAASEQAKSRSDVMSVAGLREAKGSDSALRYQLFYNGLIGGESFLWLKGQLSALSLFEVPNRSLLLLPACPPTPTPATSITNGAGL